MPPLNLVADFGGGSMFVLLGIVAALYERERSGKGQVIDAAMVDGVSVLAQMMRTMKSTGALRDELLAGLGLSADEVPGPLDIGSYPRMREIFTERFASKTRDEWAAIFAGTDAGVTAVLNWSEAAADPHITARATVISAHGVEQAAPAPRFYRTAAGPVGRPPTGTTQLDEIGW